MTTTETSVKLIILSLKTDFKCFTYIYYIPSITMCSDDQPIYNVMKLFITPLKTGLVCEKKFAHIYRKEFV